MVLNPNWILGLLAGLLLILAATWSKTPSSTPRDLIDWVEDPAHGLHVNKTLGPYRFSVQAKPPAYIIARESPPEALTSERVAERRRQLGEEMDYYNFTIAPAHSSRSVLQTAAQQEADYYALIDYFSYAAQDDFYLLHGADTSRCLLYQFVRSYELAPQLEFTMAFERQPQSDPTFVYDDRVLGVGTVKTRLRSADLLQLPTLKTP
ncbi:MAG: hypothetical protein AAFW73_18100 [Bacteroidota bacterium]